MLEGVLHDARELLRAELLLAKEEFRREVLAARRSLVAFVLVVVFSSTGLAVLLVALAMSFAPGAVPLAIWGLGVRARSDRRRGGGSSHSPRGFSTRPGGDSRTMSQPEGAPHMTDEDRRELERQATTCAVACSPGSILLARRKAEVVKFHPSFARSAGPLAWGTVLLTAGVVGVVASARRKRRSTRWTRPLATLVAPRPPSLVKRLGQRLLLLAAGAIAQRAIVVG